MKLTKRKGFNFFRSYYDVYNELENDADKVAFIDALLDRQFLGVKPTDLKGMAKFAYISQTNSIDSQVKGYEDKTGTTLGVVTTPCVGGAQGGKDTPTLQVQEEVKGKGKVQEQDARFSFKNSLLELGAEEQHIDDWIKARGKKGRNTETALKTFTKAVLADNCEIAKAVEFLAGKGWIGWKSEYAKELKPNTELTGEELREARYQERKKLGFSGARY